MNKTKDFNAPIANTSGSSLDVPLVLQNGLRIKNRFFKSAMSEQLGDANHAPDHRLVELYRTWARGGAGVLVTGNVMIDSSALGEPKNVVLEDDRHIDRFRAWAKAGTENGASLWMQLNHPGKQIPNFLNKAPVAPSAIGLGSGLEKLFNVPRALTDEEIEALIERFAASAGLAKRAGFSGVQIHGAHGYLVSQFLSPKHNQRTDRWGGSLANRMRFVLAVYRAIRREVGDDFPIGIKLNSADFQRGGFDQDESMEVVRTLAAAGIDLIEISGGTYESPSMMGARASTQQREAYFLDYADKVRHLVDTPLVVTGGFRSRAGMEAALASGATDMIGLARPFAVRPELPSEALADVGFELKIARPTTGLGQLDKMAMLDITWYEHQLARIARGKRPKRRLSAWEVTVRTFLATGVHAFRQRRARAA